ncbi:MAG TPA: hypothetical protein VFQ61_03045 [Polyangiaceae bacterium]|nr:hypothetical protein [Polyangiaceae bacterium]
MTSPTSATPSSVHRSASLLEVEAGLIKAGLGAKAGLISKAVRSPNASGNPSATLISSNTAVAGRLIEAPGAVLSAPLARTENPNLAKPTRIEPTGVLPFGITELDGVLPEGGLMKGGVVELAAGEGVPATSLALAVCRSMQQFRAHQGQAMSWAAFVDPSESLHAPGVLACGVHLEQLLVVRPPLEALARSVLRLAKSSAFELVVVDLLGTAGAILKLNLDPWVRWVRRLAIELEGSARSVLLVTDLSAHRTLPLPVAQRLELKRPKVDRLWLRVAKDRNGHVTAPRSITWRGVASGSPTTASDRASPLQSNLAYGPTAPVQARPTPEELHVASG